MTFWKWFGILVEYFSNHGKLCDCVVQMKAYNKNADITEEREGFFMDKCNLLSTFKHNGLFSIG